MRNWILALLIIMFVLLEKTTAQSLPSNFNLVVNGGLEFRTSYGFISTDTAFTREGNCWIAATETGILPFSSSYFKRNIKIGYPHRGENTFWCRTSTSWWKDPSVIDTGYKFGSYRAYPETQLLEKLKKDSVYFFSMYLGARKNTSGIDSLTLLGWPYIIKNIGVYFSANKIYKKELGSLDLTPQINFTEWDIPYDDSFMYIKLSASYKASGGEEYLIIGNFDHYYDFKFSGRALLDNTLINGIETYYPLIDDISLVRDTTQPMISLDKFSLGNDTMLCAGDTLHLGGEPYFFAYKWNTGETSRFINITKPGTYWCSADFGCNTVTDTIVISGSVAPDPFNIEDTALCETAMPLSISAPYTAATYLWSNGSTGFTASFASAGKHWLRISNACGDKSITDTFEIKSLNVALGNINLGNDTSNCLFDYYLDTITLQVPANAASNIIWSTGSSNPVIRVFEPGAYWVQVSNVCYSVSDTINISGCANRTVEKIAIPSAFTPNGDGKNDVFRILYLPGQVVSFSLKIFNRYGQMIKELKNRNDYWDGGKYELGVYYYLFVYKDVTGKEYLQKGDLSLIR